MSRGRHVPAKLVSTRTAKEPRAAKIVVCGCSMTVSAKKKTAGMTIAARAALFSETSPGSSIRMRPRTRSIVRGEEDLPGDMRAGSSAPARLSSARRRLFGLKPWRQPSRRTTPGGGRGALGSSHTATFGGSTMIVMFSARRLKPGAWEQFRRAWDPGDAKPPGFQRAYHARNIRDEDEIISFGLFDMTEDDYRNWRAENDDQENHRVDRLSAFVQNEYVSGVYEVVDTVDE